MTRSSPVTELCPNSNRQSDNNGSEAAVRKIDDFDVSADIAKVNAQSHCNQKQPVYLGK